LSEKSPPRPHGPTVRLFHRHAPDFLFRVGSLTRVSEKQFNSTEELNEVPFDDYYHPGHDRHSDRDLAER
jgi:hypothetical protein